jgi:uncharacterized membrane protein SpoIIM required for sporulation
MLKNIFGAYKKRGILLITIAVIYLLSLATGLTTGFRGPEPLKFWIEKQEQSQSEQIEKIFGRFREPVRTGEIGAIIKCISIVFGFNLLGGVTHTISSIFILPVFFYLVFGGWMQGISLTSLHGSSFLSIFLFLLMGSLEWSTYVITVAAGVNIGLSVIFPKRFDTPSRWQAFKSAWCEAGKLYVIVIIILAIQAIFEILYVRKVLLMGGTGVPLLPY